MPREAALALTEQANAATRAGNLKSAQAALQRAKDVHGRPTADLELNARIGLVDGWIAFAQRDYMRARELFKQSREHAESAFGPHGSKTRDAIRGQMWTERQLRNFDEALRLLDLLETAVANGAEVDATDVAAIAKDRADLLFNVDRFDQSLQVAMTAAAKCAADLGPSHARCTTLLLSKVNAMLRLGLAEDAVEELPALEAIANDRTAPALRASAVLSVLRVDMASGNRVRLEVSSQRVKSLVESSEGDTLGVAFKTKALLELAEARLRSAEPLEAERLIESTISLQRRSDGVVPASLETARAKSLRGIALLERGRGTESLQSLSDCRSDLSALYGPNAATTRLFSLNLALALERLNHDDEALALVNQAEPVLRSAFGPNAPTYLRVRAFQDRLVRARGAASSNESVSAARERNGVAQENRRSIDFFG